MIKNIFTLHTPRIPILITFSQSPAEAVPQIPPALKHPYAKSNPYHSLNHNPFSWFIFNVLIQINRDDFGKCSVTLFIKNHESKRGRFILYQKY